MNSNMNTDPEDGPAWTVEELAVELPRYEEELSTAGGPRSQLTSFVYPVHKFLSWLDEPYSPIRATPSRPPIQPRVSDDIVMRGGRGGSTAVPRGASRYDALRVRLSESSEPRISLSFGEISRIIGGLPASAYKHRAWWAGDRSGSHSHARSWLEANPPRRTANVDLNAQTVDFVIEERR